MSKGVELVGCHNVQIRGLKTSGFDVGLSIFGSDTVEIYRYESEDLQALAIADSNNVSLDEVIAGYTSNGRLNDLPTSAEARKKISALFHGLPEDIRTDADSAVESIMDADKDSLAARWKDFRSGLADYSQIAVSVGQILVWLISGADK